MKIFPWWALTALVLASGCGSTSGDTSDAGPPSSGSGSGTSGNGTSGGSGSETTSGAGTGASAGSSGTNPTSGSGEPASGVDSTSGVDTSDAAASGTGGDTTGSGSDQSGSVSSPPDNDGSAPPPVDAGLQPIAVPTTDRTKVQLASGWKFMASNTLTGAETTAYNDSAWSTISVPHTWDSVTANSNAIASYSNSWYRTHFTVSAANTKKRTYVYFEGAFHIADVYVNGMHLGQHRGGYTHFIYDATAAITSGDNVLAVMVGNKNCSDCLPEGNARLMKGYGGIYRKVWVLTTNPEHIATTDYASNGLYVTPSAVSSTSASISAKVMLTNDMTTDATFAVKAVISDAAGNAVFTGQSSVAVKASATVPTTLTGTVPSPKLWSPTNPNLYNIVVTVADGATVTDAIGDHIGFRSYQLTTTDFTLNGVSTRLRGMAKHQETEYHASAVTDDELITDWNNLKEMGANYVRLVHYPHAQLEYDLADQLGLMVWAENGHTNGDPGTPNGDYINKEMIYQNWNHPSIVFWSCGNEASGVNASTEYAGVIKATDPSRPVVYASDGQTPAGVDFIFHNVYDGWYSGNLYGFLTDNSHWFSETGAGATLTTHTADPFGMKFTVNSYEPEEYGALVNEIRFDDLNRKPSHVPAYSGWVFRDISDVKYKNRLNTKGIITFAGYKKDIFYLFKSLFSGTPVVHLIGSDYFLRGGADVKAYSNSSSLTLTVNGTAAAPLAKDKYTHPNGDPITDTFLWTNVLQAGKNVISVADASGNKDTMTVYYLGSGTLPADSTAKVTNLTASPGPAYFIDAPIADQHPFYTDFDGTGDNTFDVVPSVVAGASFIATKRQSDSAKRTNLAFDLPTGADVYIMFTAQGGAPAWVTAGGFTDTGVTGKWRDNSPALVNYSLYKKTFAAAAHVALTTTAIDYVVLVK